MNEKMMKRNETVGGDQEKKAVHDRRRARCASKSFAKVPATRYPIIPESRTLRNALNYPTRIKRRPVDGKILCTRETTALTRG